MQCPKCGYVLADMETECRRCQQVGVPAAGPTPERVMLTLAAAETEKECPRCGKATEAEATACGKCGYQFHPDSSRAERYQAQLAEEARTSPPQPSALRRTLPPALSWSIIGASILAIGIAGWGLFGGIITGDEMRSLSDSAPAATPLRHKPHHTALRSVTYKVAGTAAQAVIMYHTADGNLLALPESVPLPWSQTFKARVGTALLVSARPSDLTGTVIVEIDVDGVPQKQAPILSADGRTTLSSIL